MSCRALLLLGTALLAPACTVHTGTYPEAAAPVVYGNAPAYSYSYGYAPVYVQPQTVAGPGSCTPPYAGAPIYTAPVQARAPVYSTHVDAPAVAPAAAAPRIVLQNPRIVAPPVREPRVVHAREPRVVRAPEPGAVRAVEPRVVGTPRVVAGPVAPRPAAPGGVERPATSGVAVAAPHAPGPLVDPSRIHAPVRNVSLRPLNVHPVVYQPLPTAQRIANRTRL